MGIFRAFLEANRRLSMALYGHWPHERLDTNIRYCEEVVRVIRRRPGQLVADIGGGRSLRYAEYLERGEAHVIAVDVSGEELALNTDVAETRLADAGTGLPFADGELDVLTSSSVIEHVRDVAGFLDESARVLKPDGVMVHILPCRYASFALLNLALPHGAKSWLLGRLYPSTQGICGFRAYYDLCSYRALTRACRERGFRVDEVTLGYNGSSEYYAVLFPVFLVSELVELTIWLLKVRNLATTMVIVASRVPSGAEPALAAEPIARAS